MRRQRLLGFANWLCSGNGAQIGQSFLGGAARYLTQDAVQGRVGKWPKGREHKKGTLPSPLFLVAASNKVLVA